MGGGDCTAHPGGGGAQRSNTRVEFCSIATEMSVMALLLWGLTVVTAPFVTLRNIARDREEVEEVEVCNRKWQSDAVMQWQE